MKSFFKISVSCFILIGILQACQNNPHIIKSAFQKSLVQKHIKGIPYYLSLPVNYIIKEYNGPDFSVYYFYPRDAADKKSFRGGFYLGNSPGSSSRDYNNCKLGSISSNFLDDNKKWTVYNCDTIYSIQIITDSKSGYDWARYIHAFGRATSKIEVNKLVEVYSTLKIQN